MLTHASRVEDFHVTHDGILLYASGDERGPCAARRPDVPVVGLFGSSITFGSQLSRAEAFAAQLEERLQQTPGSDRCVNDYSEPGFGPEQQWALAREVIPATRPRAVVWELWDPRKHYSVVGHVAFDARGRQLDARGVPVLWPVPAAVADELFQWSYAYQYAALALAPVMPEVATRPAAEVAALCETILPTLKQLAADAHARLLVLVASPLDRPFAEARPSGDVRTVVDCAARLGMELVWIARILEDQRVEDVRLDTCCHLNAVGHELLAKRLAPLMATETP